MQTCTIAKFPPYGYQYTVMAGLYRRLLVEITGDYWRLQEITGDYYWRLQEITGA